MTYPKRIMTIKELMKLGFPEGYLRRLYAKRGQKMAWKVGIYSNSAILFDTEELEAYRKKQCNFR